MKKMLVLICLLMVAVIPATSLAVNLNGCSIANGVVTAPLYTDLIAPYTGTLEKFNLKVGETVTAGQELIKMLMTDVYAPITGKVSYIFAKEGDDADTVCGSYGGLFGIEPEQLLQVECTTAGAYSKAENKTIHIGEKVYLRSVNNNKQTGEGIVIAVDNNSYVVELHVVNGLEIGDSSINIYRNTSYQKSSCIGRGNVTRRKDSMVLGSGRVYKIISEVGNSISTGTLMAQLIGIDAAPDATPSIIVPQDGVIGAIMAEPGSSVWKGQALIRIYHTNKLEVKAEVDEVDLKNVKVGDTLTVILDAYDAEQIEGTVTEISSVGITQSNAAYFDVYVSIPTGKAKIGQNASVYIPKEDASVEEDFIEDTFIEDVEEE